MGEAAAGAPIFFRHRGAQQTGRTRFCPDVALIHAGVVPAVDVRGVFVADETPRLLLEQNEVLGHPRRPRNVEGIHSERFPDDSGFWAQ